ncbi:hypothetical protein C8R46DRAFT_425263 [Mycena filopes]|nr:hypothetical protein C8R46DRAFT_425263 [Mycena filopes]
MQAPENEGITYESAGYACVGLRLRDERRIVRLGGRLGLGLGSSVSTDCGGCLCCSGGNTSSIQLRSIPQALTSACDDGPLFVLAIPRSARRRERRPRPTAERLPPEEGIDQRDAIRMLRLPQDSTWCCSAPCSTRGPPPANGGPAPAAAAHTSRGPRTPPLLLRVPLPIPAPVHCAPYIPSSSSSLSPSGSSVPATRTSVASPRRRPTFTRFFS